jgi:hypothetical protein
MLSITGWVTVTNVVWRHCPILSISHFIINFLVSVTVMVPVTVVG